LESTANGPKGLFYDMCQLALKDPPMGDYTLIFVPWFWQDEYERDVDPEFVPTKKEEDLITSHIRAKPFPFDAQIISRERALRKIAWRRAKILSYATASGGVNLEAGEAEFRSIYPKNPIEAFLSTGIGLVQADAIEAARASKITDEFAPLLVGVDPAGDSEKSDRTVLVLRRGRVIEDVITYPHMTPMRLAGIIAQDIISKRGAEMVFIDRGYGEGTIDRLVEMGYGKYVMGIAFNERALEPDIYLNKRSEIIIKFAKWINERGVRIPDRDDVHADLACMPLDETTSIGLRCIKSKREIKKILGRSPDIYDAGALTFSFPVRRDSLPGPDGRPCRRIEKVKGTGSSGLKSLARMRRRGQ